MSVLRPLAPTLLVILIGCNPVGLSVKRQSELNCPTDIRKTVPWCAGEDAIFRCPCGPSQDFYGHKPTCWRTWPAPATVWRDAYCGLHLLPDPDAMPYGDVEGDVEGRDGESIPLPTPETQDTPAEDDGVTNVEQSVLPGDTKMAAAKSATVTSSQPTVRPRTTDRHAAPRSRQKTAAVAQPAVYAPNSQQPALDAASTISLVAADESAATESPATAEKIQFVAPAGASAHPTTRFKSQFSKLAHQGASGQD